MQRIKIELPDQILYIDSFEILAEDINEAKHMGNERILVFANDIRKRFYAHLQLKEGDWENGHGTIVVNHAINYKNEGFAGDKITCQVGVTNVTECSFDLVLHFIKNQEKTLAVLRTGKVYFDYNERKIRPLPQAFLQAFGVTLPA